MAMVPRPAPLLPRRGMGVVEPDQPLAFRPMQRWRTVKPVRLLRRRWRLRHHASVGGSGPAQTFEYDAEGRLATDLADRDARQWLDLFL